MKKFIILLFFIFFTHNVHAQTLFKFQIEPNQPVWEFELIWQDDFAKKLTAKSPHNSTPLLIATFGDTNIQKSTHAQLKNLVEAVDYNFDGFNDVRMMASQGTGGIIYDIWLFEPKEKIFIKHNGLSELFSPEPNAQTKLITSISADAKAGQNVTQFFKIENNELIPTVTVKKKQDDLEAFIKKREACIHWQGEEPYDEERKKEIITNVNKHCTGTVEKLQELIKANQNSPQLLERLKKLED